MSSGRAPRALQPAQIYPLSSEEPAELAGMGRGARATATVQRGAAVSTWPHGLDTAALLAAAVLDLAALLLALLRALPAAAALLMAQSRARAERCCSRLRRHVGFRGAAWLACALLVRPAGAQTNQTCTTSSWMYVGGFTGTSATALNGYYAPYFTASAAPTGLQACTNSGYSGPSAASFNTAWQTGTGTTRPVGYYNTRSNLSDATNSFWVRFGPPRDARA